MSSQALSHAQKVTRLYRKTLKNMLSWTVQREMWRKEACELRATFDANKNVDMARAIKLLEEGEAEFQRHKHPDPYIGKVYGVALIGVKVQLGGTKKIHNGTRPFHLMPPPPPPPMVKGLLLLLKYEYCILLYCRA